MSETSASISANVISLIDDVLAPSATVSGLWTDWSVFERNDRVASSPAEGSTPTTRHDGESVAAARAQPARSPPPQIEISDVFKQLARRRPLSRDDVRIVVRRDEGEAAFFRQPAADGFAVVAIAVVRDDFGAVAFGGRALHRRRVVGHDDDARDVQ
jgi:hypothetical protein